MNKPKIAYKNNFKWLSSKFKDIYMKASEGGTPPTNIKEFYENGTIPFIKIEDTENKYITTGKNFITELGLKNSSAWVIPKNNIILTNGATVGNIAINKIPISTKQGILGIILKKDFDLEYLYYLLNSQYFKKEINKRKTKGTFETIILKYLDEIEITYPSNLKEQQKISTFLSAFDLKIEHEFQIIEQLKQLKKSLLYKMFPTENSNIPELRFKGFTDVWEQRKLKDFTERIIEKNKNLDTLLPLTISTQYGLISQTEFFNKQIASKNLSNYYLLKKGDFAYNKSYSGEAPWGSIKRLDKYEKGALSTLYIAFKIKNINQIDSEFLNTFYKTNKWYTDIQNIATEGARNHGLLNISSNDFFETFIKIPNIEEQEKIGELFSKIDSLITLHQYMYNKLFQVKNNIFPRYSAYYSNILHNFLPIIFTYAQPQYKSHTKKIY